MAEPLYRIGTGWDSHRFRAGLPLWLGGVRIEHPAGLEGHSDGDVLLHAVCDALLGAIAAGDIGAHFPSADPQWRGAASARFVRHALQLVRRAGWQIVNLDATLVLAEPRVAPLREALRESLAMLLEIPGDRVSVKGKTPEGLATDQAAIAQAVVLLERSAAR